MVAKKTTKKETKEESPRLTRDSDGLIEGIEYKFSEDGSINWREMIEPQHLVPHKEWFDRKKQKVPESIEGLSDEQLLIKLSGIKQVARLRGFKSVKFRFEKVEPSYVSCVCNIVWNGNYETFGEDVEFEGCANATIQNTNGFGAKFLEAIASNRAFVRCVRNFLEINIIGDDEIDKNNNSMGGYSEDSRDMLTDLGPQNILKTTLAGKHGISNIEEFKNLLRVWWKDGKYKNEAASKWNSFADIPAKDARVIFDILKCG